MIYLFYGKDTFLINKEIESIKKKEKIDEINVVSYNFSTDSLDNIIDDCDSVSLFSDKKIVIINNITIFNRIKNEVEINLDKFTSYLNNPNPDTILILINNNETIDNTKKITNLIKTVGVVKEFNHKYVNNIVKEMFKDYKITDQEIALLINRVGDNLEILNMEIEKIKTYKNDDKLITKTDILNLTNFNIDVSSYNFVDQIIQKNKDAAIKIYDELLIMHDDPAKVIALLASKFRIIYQSIVLKKMGYSFNGIMETLDVKEYPLKLALEASMRTTEEEMLNKLLELANLEIDIKTGSINSNLGMQLFILNI